MGRGSCPPAEGAAPHAPMTKALSVQLALYSLLLAAGSFLVHHLAQAAGRTTFLAGLAGAALALLWAARGLAGARGKALPILTLVPVSFVLLSQTVLGWWGSDANAMPNHAAAAVTTLLLMLTLAMLMRIAYAGIVFDGVPGRQGPPGEPAASVRPAQPPLSGSVRK